MDGTEFGSQGQNNLREVKGDKRTKSQEEKGRREGRRGRGMGLAGVSLEGTSEEVGRGK